MKGDISEYKVELANAYTCVFTVREGTVPEDWKVGDVVCTSTLGDGDLLGIYKIYRNYGIPNG